MCATQNVGFHVLLARLIFPNFECCRSIGETSSYFIACHGHTFLFMSLHRNTNILLIGKEPDFIRLIEPLLYDIGCGHLYVQGNIDDGMKILQTNRVDICMIGLSTLANNPGLRRAAESIRINHPSLPLILICRESNEEIYLQFRHIRPSSFLSMEVSKLSLLQAIDLAMQQTAPGLQAVKDGSGVRMPDHTRPHFFKVGDAYQVLPMQEVQYFYASEKLTYAKVAKQLFPTNTHLKILEKVLQDDFIRIHKTYLVNINHIESIHTAENNVVIDGQKLPIGNSYRRAFLDRMPLL